MAPIRPKNRNRMQAWQKAAVSCGLQIMKTHDSPQLRLEALAGLLWVRIETCGDNGRSTRIAVVAPGSPDFVVVRIRPESSILFPSEQEIEIGDELFDSTFIIEGPVGMVLALLDAETRRLLLSLKTEARLEICLGELRAENDSDEKLLALLPLLLDAGKWFARPPDVPRRLAENVRQDPEARVRLQNLLVLIRECSEEPETAEALRAARSDSSPEIRLRAAKALGSEGRDVLLEIAEGGVDDTLSAEAVSALGRELPFEPAKAILDRALDLRHLQTAHACVEALGLGGGAAAVDPLARVLAQEKGELATAAVQALGATGSPAAEAPLILALQHEERDLRIAAANALGRAGSPSAVLPLKETAERSWLDRELRRTARQAIIEIQSRLQSASPGQLSLAGAEAGQLSLAQADTGQLSLSADPAGQLSLGAGDPPKED
jgi:HEAT repeat protein